MKNVLVVVGIVAFVGWAYLTGRTPQEAVGVVFYIAFAPGLFVIKTPLVETGLWPWFQGLWFAIPVILIIFLSLLTWGILWDIFLCLIGKEPVNPNPKFRRFEQRTAIWRKPIRNFRNRNRVR